jgi:hypothetical protein
MRKPIFEIDLALYNDALKLSLHDNEWISKAFENKQNIKELLKNVTKQDTLIATNEYIAKNDLGKIFKYKKIRSLDESTILYLFDQNAEQSKINLINQIKNKTTRNTNIIKNLIEEYSINTRDVFDAKILPFPDKIEDTVKPITKFKIQLTEQKFFALEIGENELLVEDSSDNFIQIQEYFQERKKKKRITRGYLTKEQITQTQVQNLLEKLNYLKEVEIPFNYALKQGDYKIVYREHQVAHLSDKDVTINDRNLRILHIGEQQL